ncbi:hypothetical protein Taro_000904 [Colocasia esculenta]|uniref:Uncharacterized protein n=1 Tax=Colocasia esculenta TaxID=4460 RepID=A0A843TDC0_COLES|nr:hypothetical protein [Colocasia esculenta]
MSSRGRRGGAPAREDDPRREERAEQQASAPQGPVLPPPPPVDYGVFMKELMYGELHYYVRSLKMARLMLRGTSSGGSFGPSSSPSIFKIGWSRSSSLWLKAP